MLLLFIYLLIRSYISFRNKLRDFKNNAEKIAAVRAMKEKARTQGFAERLVNTSALTIVEKILT